jgi:hypothetical protein
MKKRETIGVAVWVILILFVLIWLGYEADIGKHFRKGSTTSNAQYIRGTGGLEIQFRNEGGNCVWVPRIINMPKMAKAEEVSGSQNHDLKEIRAVHFSALDTKLIENSY